MVYTSGTTGRSKGAVLSHGNLLSNAQTLTQAWDWRPDDVLIHTLPIFHVHGLFVATHSALLNGSTMLWLPKFEPQAVIERFARATVFMGVPTLYVRMLEQTSLTREACRSMRLFVSGSAPLLMDTFDQWEERTGQQILERYGMSETVMLTSNPCRSADGPRRGGTVGRPLEGVSVRVVGERGQPLPAGEIGGIEVKGPNVFSGYLRMPEKTAEDFTSDGWFKTGDVGRFDAQGYLSIVGRSKDLIISGGFNVYPAEIEGFLNEMAEIAESAVVGVPHPGLWRMRDRLRGAAGRGAARRGGADRHAEAPDRQLQGAQAHLHGGRTAAQRHGQGAEGAAAGAAAGLVRVGGLTRSGPVRPARSLSGLGHGPCWAPKGAQSGTGSGPPLSGPTLRAATRPRAGHGLGPTGS